MPRINKWLGDALEGLMPSRIPIMQVTETALLSPNLKRIVLEGNLPDVDYQPGYAVAIRVSDTEYRNYTPSFYNRNQNKMEMIVHTHGEAPGSNFIQQLQPGASIRVTMPRGKKMYDPAQAQHHFFGDETSLGLACVFQDFCVANNHEVRFLFELDQVNNTIPKQLGLKNATTYSKHSYFRDAAVLHLSPVFDIEDWQLSNFVLTGNVNSVQTFRKVLKEKKLKGQIFSQGYWMEGKTGL